MNHGAVVYNDTIWSNRYGVSVSPQGIQIPLESVACTLERLVFSIPIHVKSWEGGAIRMVLVTIPLKDNENLYLHIWHNSAANKLRGWAHDITDLLKPAKRDGLPPAYYPMILTAWRMNVNLICGQNT